eukprot:598771-Hanusia_phi.AAC.1
MEEGFVRGAVCDQAGAVYVAAETGNGAWVGSISGRSLFVMLFDFYGELVWNVSVAGSRIVLYKDLILDDQGSLLFVASILDPMNAYYGAMKEKYNQDGFLQWKSGIYFQESARVLGILFSGDEILLLAEESSLVYQNLVHLKLSRISMSVNCTGISFGNNFECPAGHYCPSGIQNALDG